MTMLYIIGHLSKQKDKKHGLSNNAPKILTKNVSGAEILQVWVLLLNAGHLRGTFASERALLHCLKKDTVLRATFREGLPRDSEIKSFLKEIIDNEDVYRVHELIAFFFLNRLRRKSSTDTDLLIEVLKLFKFSPKTGEERRRKLKYLFRRIRKVSFLFLDSLYGPTPLVFELGKTLFDFEEHSKSLFSIEESPLANNLDSFSELLSENFYLAPRCMYAFGKQSRRIEDKIEEFGRNGKGSIPKLYKFIKNGHTLDTKYWPKDPDLLLRLWFDERKSPISILEKIKPIVLETDLNKKLPQTYCEATVLHDPSKKMMGITLGFAENIRTVSMARVLSLVMSNLISLQDFYKDKMLVKSRDPYRKVFQQSCKELVLFSLRQLWGKNLTFSPVQHTIHADHWIIERGSTKASVWLDEQKKWYEQRGVEQDRLHELRTLSKALEEISHRGIVLFSTSQIIARKKIDGSDITDLDGVAICAHSKELSLVLVEAKNKGAKSASQAKKSIKETLAAMEITTVKDEDIHMIPSFGAYVKISLYSSAVKGEVNSGENSSGATILIKP